MGTRSSSCLKCWRLNTLSLSWRNALHWNGLCHGNFDPFPGMSLPLWWLVLEIQRPNTFVLIWITSLKDCFCSSASHGLGCNCMQSPFSLCPILLCSCPYKRTPPKTSCIPLADFESDFWWTWPKTNALSHLNFISFFFFNPMKGKSISTSFSGFDGDVFSCPSLQNQ